MTTRSVSQPPKSPTLRVVDAIANQTDVDPTELTPPLGTVIDPEALDAVFEADASSDLRVSFEYAGYLVSLSSNEDVSIEPLEGPR